MNCPTILLAILGFCLNILSEDRFRFCYVIGNHFIRNRKLGFKDFMLCLAFSPKKSLQSMLYSYIQNIRKTDIKYSKQAYSKQRQFIRPEALFEFVNASIQKFYTMAAFRTFHGYIVTAIDGSRYNLPDSLKLREKYGEQITSGNPQIQALGSCLYDVFNGLILHCLFEPCKSNERELAKRHIDALENVPYDRFLLLLDRGYPSYDLIQRIQDRGLLFIMRASSEFIRNFNLNGRDSLITHTFNSYPKASVTMRVISAMVPFGEKIYLITNLMDKNITADELTQLYYTRWKIETKYNDLKNKLDIENFSGITDVAIRQDYYATVFLANLAATLVFEMKDTIQSTRKEGNKYLYQQNMNLTIGELRANVIKLVLANSQAEQESLMIEIVKRLLNAVVPIRLNRSFKREKKHKTRQFSQNTKRA